MLCIALALLIMVFAVAYQRRDIVRGHGGTMGGEMTTGILWLAAALLMAIGAYGYFPWYVSVLVLIVTILVSFMIRVAVARIPKSNTSIRDSV